MKAPMYIETNTFKAKLEEKKMKMHKDRLKQIENRKANIPKVKKVSK